MNNNHKDNEKVYFFDKPENIKRLLLIFYICCGLLFALDFVIHRHVMHDWEKIWGFYPLYGFVGCVLLVLVASWMRKILMRPEDYYDEKENTEDSNNKASVGANHVDD